jgi:phage repressor protein C with HTH and peptisase S24 domain
MVQYMGFHEDMIHNLDFALKKRFDSKPYRLAKAAGTHSTTLGRILDGERSKWLKALGKIADAAGLKVVSEDEFHGPEYAFIRKAQARPAAGGGSLETSGETEGGLAFRLEWLRTRTPASPDRLRVMEISGDSMAPTINHGDVVLVDESDNARELGEDRVYVVRKGEGIYVKRFRRAPDALIFMGDNRARDYQDVRVVPGDEDGFAVIGRVLWAGKEL